MKLNEFIYRKMTTKLTSYPKIKILFKTLNKHIYKNTFLNRDYRIQKWIKNSNKFIQKNKLCSITLDGEQTYFLNDSIKYIYDCQAEGGGAPKYIDSECDKNIFDYLIKSFSSSKELVIFDIGANIGIYSLKLAKKFKNSKIYAFEPISSTYNILIKNVKLNNFNNIFCYDEAISDKNGETSMTTDEFAGNHITEKNNKTNISLIKTITVDSFIEKEKITSADIIKCDVEGAELMMLKGAIKSIQKFRPMIILEVFESWTKRYNYLPEDIFKLLLDMGYTYKVANAEIKKGNIKNLKEELSHCINFIFEYKK